MHRWPQGPKTTSFILASFFFVSITPILFSQPAKAESFLLKTVRCVVGAVLPLECRNAQTPNAPVPPAAPANPNVPVKPAPPKASPAHPAEPSTPASSDNKSGTNVQSRTPYVSGGVGGEPIDISNHAPIEIQFQSAGQRSPMTSSYEFPQSRSPGYYFNTYGNLQHAKIPKNVAASFVEPSQEGWKIAGVAWYWWLGALLLVTGAIWYGKYTSFKKKSSLSKAL